MYQYHSAEAFNESWVDNDGRLLKHNLWCKACIHPNIIIPFPLKKTAQADKLRESGNDSLIDEIRWCLSSQGSVENMEQQASYFTHICCCISISYLWSTCLYHHGSQVQIQNYKIYKTLKCKLHRVVSKFHIKTSGCEWKWWLKRGVGGLGMLLPGKNTVILFVSPGMHECVYILLTDACVLCWRELCSSRFPPGQARPLCPASWDFWEASFWFGDISDETCCTGARRETRLTAQIKWRLFTLVWDGVPWPFSPDLPWRLRASTKKHVCTHMYMHCWTARLIIFFHSHFREPERDWSRITASLIQIIASLYFCLC